MGPADTDESGPGAGAASGAGAAPAPDGSAGPDSTGIVDSRDEPGSGASSGPPAADATAPAAAPPHRSRKKKILAWTAGSVAVVLLLAVGGVYAVYRHLNGNLHQVDIAGELGSQPVDLHPQAENIMIIGSDTRNGQGKGFGQNLTTDQSDTLMILHIAADRKWADVMSIPRDSWVNIPACKMGDSQMSSPTTFKINEAFALGNLYGNHTDLGVACTIKTLELDTGIHIDHFVSVNFAGFRDMVNAVGGVEECNTTAINDPKSGLYLSAGHHLLGGWEALAYVRARYTLGNGSDLERIGRQQAFMSSLITKVKSKMLNPVAIYNFLDAATKSLTIDSQLGGIHGLYDLAMSVRSLPSSQVTFFTLPTYPRSLVVPTDTANVLWTQPEDSAIFQAFRNDTPVGTALLQPVKPPKISPDSVSVVVRNGTQQYGLQDNVAGVLQQNGFKVASTSQDTAQNVTETVIKYHAGSQAEAMLLESKIPGSAILQVPGTGSTLTLVLGSDYGTTAHAVGAAQAATPTPSPSFSSRTASQNICAS
ncbi:MAG TPA: LCP family protein [Streptosporangiaceae bacterium]|nr:LCP family protein [Streptosporangiaceae bacterium]